MQTLKSKIHLIIFFTKDFALIFVVCADMFTNDRMPLFKCRGQAAAFGRRVSSLL